jgi:hypothetical protein
MWAAARFEAFKIDSIRAIASIAKRSVMALIERQSRCADHALLSQFHGSNLTTKKVRHRIDFS